MTPEEIARKAKEASKALARVSTKEKNEVLLVLEGLIAHRRDFLMGENRRDVEKAERDGMAASLVERLRMTSKILGEMEASLRDVVALPDPVGDIGKLWKRPNGLLVGRMRIPIGVICIIYESRPNVTVDAFSLCFKSGNAVILKGGSEAHYSNRALFNLIVEAIQEVGLSTDCVQLVETPDRDYLYELLKLTDQVDLVIPRGGEALIRSVAEHSRVPVLKHYKGVCSIFVDEHADIDLAQKVCLNAKVQKPATCNALETMLVHRAIAPRFLPGMIDLLRDQGVYIKGCTKVAELVADVEEATEEDWYEEYLDFTLNIRIVDGLDQAVQHISTYGSEHTDAIITQDYSNAWRFVREVNSSLVLVNASTRLNDGFQLGLGAEMGISTTKLHAFGPMGLEELTVTKFIAFGEGQVRG
ncbi:MAG TPA: glutamate-5-semialdehyde dehydrogenase [Deltaproteobacteria bacterium]|nr:glutamate-5-semialdehyde dehydrogenase [Deltaproteobacteria bacterium]